MPTIEDRIAIQDLNHRYCRSVDAFLIDEWCDLFTQDGCFDETEFGLGAHHGRSGIKGYGHVLQNTYALMAHFMSNHLVENLTETTATGSAMAVVELQAHDGSRGRFIATYQDIYEKVSGDWKFKKRYVKKTFEPERL